MREEMAGPRRVALGLAAAILLTGVASAEPCVTPAQRQAFQVGALQSQMMVAALACQAHDAYNATVRRFRPEFAARQRVVAGWFKANYGVDWRASHDSYVTSLANDLGKAQAEIPGLYSVPCRDTVALFAELSAVRRAVDLAPLAASKGISLPIEIISCAASVQAR